MRSKLFVSLLFILFFIFSCGGGLKSPEKDEDSTEKDDTDTTESVCGDEIVSGDEVCDGNLGLCTEIDPKLYKAGKAFCKDDCSGWETATCEEVPHECGNSIIEGPEECDTLTQLCTDFDATKYKSGTVTCATDCLSQDFSDCEELNAECGDKIVEGGEICDGNTINCRDIDDDRFVGGIALCKKDCSNWDTLTCEEKSDYDPPLDEDTTTVDEDTQSDEDVVCVTDCEIVGAKRCTLGTNVESCQMVDSVCKMWRPLLDCNDSGRFCHDYLVIGNDATNNVRNHVLKGNYVQATTAMAVRSFDMKLNITTEQQLTWVIYEADTKTGPYSLVFQNDVEHPGTGINFYNSGPLFKNALPFRVEVGKYYLFGVAWENDMVSYYHDYSYSTQEEETFFGPVEGGTANADSWPIKSTMDGPAGNSVYFMRFDTDNTAPDICECINDCDTDGEEQCNGNTVQACLSDTHGCLEWKNQDDCSVHTPALVCQESGSSAECVVTSSDETVYLGDAGTQSEGSTMSYLKLDIIHATANATITGLQIKLKATTSSGSIEEFRIYESSTKTGTYNIIATHAVSVTNTTFQYVGYTNFDIPITSGYYYALGLRIGSTSDVSYFYNPRSSGLPAYDCDSFTTENGLSSSTDYPTSFNNLTMGDSIYNMKIILSH